MDPIADFLTIIRNAYLSRKEQASCPYSKTKQKIATVLKHQGFIKDFKTDSKNHHKSLHITLSYMPSGNPILTQIERVSRPSVRVYAPKNKLPHVLSGKGTAIISTSKGIMAVDQARAKGLGGEIICTVC